MSDELKYYPQGDESFDRPFQVEFDRGNVKGEFTLFRSQFFRDPATIEEKDVWAKISNRCHPWNIFTGQYGMDGCIPDKAWVCWMVDALNDKWQADKKSALAMQK